MKMYDYLVFRVVLVRIDVQVSYGTNKFRGFAIVQDICVGQFVVWLDSDNQVTLLSPVEVIGK